MWCWGRKIALVSGGKDKIMVVLNLPIESYVNSKEGLYYDRKSARIKPDDIVKHVIAFANANGGILAIGIEDDKSLTGFNSFPLKPNAKHHL